MVSLTQLFLHKILCNYMIQGNINPTHNFFHFHIIRMSQCSDHIIKYACTRQVQNLCNGNITSEKIVDLRGLSHDFLTSPVSFIPLLQNGKWSFYILVKNQSNNKMGTPYFHLLHFDPNHNLDHKMANDIRIRLINFLYRSSKNNSDVNNIFKSRKSIKSVVFEGGFYFEI